MSKINVTIWNEFTHEKQNEYVKSIYPDGLHAAIKKHLDTDENLNVRLAALDDPHQGLPDDVLNSTDVLLWWGHMRHGDVSDDLVARIRRRIISEGMGFIPLHSAHASKIFCSVIGTDGALSWGDDQPEIVWNLLPSHPIASGIPDHFVLELEELYGEPFNIPQPDELVFASWFKNGNIFRSGCCFYRGLGKVFYFQPGHESCRSFHNPYVLKIISNAVYWTAPNKFGVNVPTSCPWIPSVTEKHGI
ncbi:MAG: ThuA domain-containing protein [Eubacteriales bacterium]|jgi:trehalose utilization protein|nr:ThuA domain-containing protein [Eubacteriales bacterium]